jgi:hypothetical protein
MAQAAASIEIPACLCLAPTALLDESLDEGS